MNTATQPPTCPYLGSVDSRGTQAPPVEYPSFENRCFATTRQEALLLTHQATFCVGGNHALCPLHRSLHGRGGMGVGGRGPEMGDWTSLSAPAGEGGQGGGVGRWLVASMALAFLLVVGGVGAAFVGWQLVNRGVVDLAGSGPVALRPQGDVAADTGSEGPLVVIVTATNTPPDPNGLNQSAPAPTPTFAFPQAVTATPVPGDFVPAVVGTPSSNAGGVVLSTPTRRVTPTFEVPTSTPLPNQTSTPAGPVPTPVVEFTVGNKTLYPGGCTIAAWNVQNVRAVFFNDVGVDGRGERRVCMENSSMTLVLSVLMLDGVARSYPLTVEMILPTSTPTATPTFTPVLTPTATWTPEGTPTITPVPTRQGTTLTVEGGSQRTCAAGAVCVINLGVANTGNLADEIFVVMVQNATWPIQICRQDNTCAGNSISLGVAPGGSLPVQLRITIPSTAIGQVAEYRFQSESGNAGRTTKSDITPVRVTVQ